MSSMTVSEARAQSEATWPGKYIHNGHSTAKATADQTIVCRHKRTLPASQ